MKVKIKRPITIKKPMDLFIPFNVVEEKENYQIIEINEKYIDKFRDIVELEIIEE